jgi:hypothetical protein
LKKIWLFLTGSIIVLILNGAFLCYSNQAAGPESPVIAPRNVETGQLRESLKTILKNPRFQYQDNLSWIKWVYQRITRLFKLRPKTLPFKIPIKGKLWRHFLNILGIAVLVASPFILAFLINHFIRYDKQMMGSFNKSTVHSLSSAELKQKAAATAKHGQYLEAIRYIYLAGLEKLKEENLLPQAAKLSDKANLKKLRAILGEDHQGYRAFLDLTKIFQEKWYGLKECEAPDYQLAESKLEIILWNVRG